jgi:hypothetical protein
VEKVNYRERKDNDMKKMTPMLLIRKMVVVCMGFMMVAGIPLPAIGSHDDHNNVSSESLPGKPQGSTTRPAPTLPSTNGTEDGSVVIGDGIRTPPDIGAAGTASPTPPLRFESPTDEPAILPDVSPVPTLPSDTESSPDPIGKPFGQPNHFKNKQE